MKQYHCLCCGHKTLDSRGDFDICPVCFWEDDLYLNFSTENSTLSSLYDRKNLTIEKVLDQYSGANHGLTLRQGRENYSTFGACDKSVLAHVRPATKNEKPRLDIKDILSNFFNNY